MKNICFFGTSEFSVTILHELKEKDIIPTLIITAPDRPKGRGLVVTAPPVKTWADMNGVDMLQPENVNDAYFTAELQNSDWDLFIVASYGKILSKKLLAIPNHGTLNVHPSLLPKLRGASPIESAILQDEKESVGVSIMLVDEEIDHGPIVAQASVAVEDWPPKASVLEALLAHEGGKLLGDVILLWVKGKITPQEQDESKATYSKKITKEDGCIDLKNDPYDNFKKIQAYGTWPGTYFFTEKNGKEIRVKITDASFENLPATPAHAGQAGGKLVIKKVIPEGKREMNYKDFQRS